MNCHVVNGWSQHNQKAPVALSVVNEFFFASLFCFWCLVMVIIQRAMMRMVVMMMMTIWTDRSPICALFPGVLRGLLTDYQWEGVDPRHPNTSNNSSATFTLSTSTPHFWIFLAFFVCDYMFDYFWVNIDSKRHPNCFNSSSTAFPLYNCQHQHLIRVMSQNHREHIILM